MKTALLVIDAQNDFFEGGRLPVADSRRIVQPLITGLLKAHKAGWLIVATQDHHLRDDPSFVANGGIWPEHCVPGHEGHEFYSDGLKWTIDRCAHAILRKQDYSGFTGTGLHALLEAHGVEEVVVAGLAQDYCVLETAKDAVRHGYRTWVPLNATAPVDPAHKLVDPAHKLAETAFQGGVVSFPETIEELF